MSATYYLVVDGLYDAVKTPRPFTLCAIRLCSIMFKFLASVNNFLIYFCQTFYFVTLLFLFKHFYRHPHGGCHHHPFHHLCKCYAHTCHRLSWYIKKKLCMTEMYMQHFKAIRKTFDLYVTSFLRIYYAALCSHYEDLGSLCTCALCSHCTASSFRHDST